MSRPTSARPGLILALVGLALVAGCPGGGGGPSPDTNGTVDGTDGTDSTDGTDGTDGTASGQCEDEGDATVDCPHVTPAGHVANAWIGWRDDADCDAFLEELAAEINGAVGADTAAPAVALSGDGAWTARPLFAVDPDDDGPEGFLSADVPEALSFYCAAGGTIDQIWLPDLSDLIDSGDLTENGRPERMVVTALTSDPLYGAFYTETLLNQTGWVDTTSPGCQPNGDATPVELVVLDTAATSARGGLLPAAETVASLFTDARMPSEHGFGMAALGRRLLCGADVPAEACLADVQTRVALPRRLTDTGRLNWAIDPATGRVGHGAVGTRADLARALYREQRRWDRSGAATRRVLNLSLGWQPVNGDLIGETWPQNRVPSERQGRPGAAAVYDALRVAQCSGALIMAAAGNETPAVDGDRLPLLPAAWAHIPFDTAAPFTDHDGTVGPVAAAASCADLLGGAPSDATLASRDALPLLYAVGGVDADQDTLALAREDSDPAFMAYGQNAAPPLFQDGAAAGSAESTWFSPMTGTSVSAVVASARAAAHWALNSTQQPAEVAAALHDGARPRSTAATPVYPVDDFYVGAFQDDTGVSRDTQTMLALTDGACATAGTPPATDPRAIPGGLTATDVSADAAGIPDPTTDDYGDVVLPQPINDPDCPNCFVQDNGGTGSAYLANTEAWTNVWVTVYPLFSPGSAYPVAPSSLAAGTHLFTLLGTPAIATAKVTYTRQITPLLKQRVSTELSVK